MNETETPIGTELDPAALEAVREASRLAGFAVGVNLVTEAHNQDLKAQLRELEHTANHDPGTGLLNQRGLEKEYGQLRHREPGHHRRRGDINATEGRILVVDLDDFKAVNDSAGHTAGNAVLRQVAEVLQANVRSQDLVARWGGDEFVIVLDPITNRRTNEIANTIRNQVAATTPITASIGICKADYTANLEATIDQADQALYAAKDSGKNIVVNFEQLGEKAVAS